MNTTETNFTDAQVQGLAALVEMIIPASEDYGVPGAGDGIIFADILSTTAPQHEAVAAALSALNAVAEATGGQNFATISAAGGDGENIAASFRDQHPKAAELLATITVQCYYRDDRVMRALNMEVRPPFPDGFTVDQGDWTLLDPVRNRPELYRKTE